MTADKRTSEQVPFPEFISRFTLALSATVFCHAAPVRFVVDAAPGAGVKMLFEEGSSIVWTHLRVEPDSEDCGVRVWRLDGKAAVGLIAGKLDWLAGDLLKSALRCEPLSKADTAWLSFWTGFRMPAALRVDFEKATQLISLTSKLAPKNDGASAAKRNPADRCTDIEVLRVMIHHAASRLPSALVAAARAPGPMTKH